MENINITTSHNVFINFQAAGIGNRAAAYLLDGLFKAIFMIGMILLGAFMTKNSTDIGIITILAFVIILLYSLLMETFFHGQTLGKMVVKIKVMKLDGTEATFSSYLLRWLLSIVDFTMSMGALAMIMVIVSKNSQRLGDMAANTTVVRIRENVNLEQLIMADVDVNYQTRFPQVRTLTDSDIQLVKDLLYAFSKAEDKMAMYNNIVTAKQKFMEKMSIQAEIEAVQFLETLIKDYLNEFGKQASV